MKQEVDKELVFCFIYLQYSPPLLQTEPRAGTGACKEYHTDKTQIHFLSILTQVQINIPRENSRTDRNISIFLNIVPFCKQYPRFTSWCHLHWLQIWPILASCKATFGLGLVSAQAKLYQIGQTDKHSNPQIGISGFDKYQREALSLFNLIQVS